MHGLPLWLWLLAAGCSMPAGDALATWQQIAVSGSTPDARFQHAAAFSEGDKALFIFGGTSAGITYRNDLWKFNVTAGSWQQVTASGSTPPTLYGHSVTFAEGERALFVFGGTGQTSGMNELWKFSVAAGSWQQLAAPGSTPIARYSHSAAFSEGDNALFIFGGANNNLPLNDFWKFSVTAGRWQQIAVSSGPSARLGHAAAFSEGDKSLFIFGGTRNSGPLNELWKFGITAGSWQQVAASNSAPSPRSHHTMAFSQSHNALFVFGGNGDSGMLNDLWKFSVAAGSWQQVATSGSTPVTREQHGAAFSQGDNALFVFGGSNNGHAGLLNDLWKFYACPPGQSYVDVCYPCAAGTFSPSGLDCVACPGGKTSNPGSATCEFFVLVDAVAALTTPRLAVRLEDAGVARMTMEVSPLPVGRTIDNVSLSYVVDLAASFGDLNSSSQCNLQWERLNDTLLTLRQPFALEGGVCRWGWSNSSGVIARSAAVAVFVVATQGAEQSVVQRWQWPLELQVPAAVASVYSHIAVTPTTLNGQTFLLAAFPAEVVFYRTETFSQKMLLPYFKVGDVVYVEHALSVDTMGMSLSLRVESVWLSTSKSADNLSAVKWDLRDFIQTYAPVTGKARFTFGAKLCDNCYLHCVSSLERRGRRLSSELALHAYSSVFVEMVGWEAALPPPLLTKDMPRFIMNAWGAIALSAVLSVVTALATGLLKRLRHKSREYIPGPATRRKKVFALMELLDTLLDWGNLATAWAAGDLDYEDDGGAIRLVLTSACVFSTLCFAFEMAIWVLDCRRGSVWLEGALPFLIYLHLCVEDVFQGMIYIFVAASHAIARFNVSISALIGAVLCGVFVAVRVTEVNGGFEKCFQEKFVKSNSYDLAVPSERLGHDTWPMGGDDED